MLMNNKVETNDNYYQDVIERWDDASGSFKNACQQANQSHSLAAKKWILWDDGSIRVVNSKVIWLKVDIDGVGTKVQIYTNQFENIFQSRERQEIDWEEAKKQSGELWYRMLMDLIAMNADDLRNGQIAVALTNIIDINHLKDKRWHLFQDSMAEAFQRAIQTTGIAMTAWETAVLWQSWEAKKISKASLNAANRIEEVLEGELSWSNAAKAIQEILNTLKNQITVIWEGISLNIWGTVLGIETKDQKLIPLDDNNYDIVGFKEKEADGIIWPRSNGITAIREWMEQIMGDGWENKTYEDFIEKIGTDKAKQIPEQVQKVCANKKLWNIATGTTTVFNPFIANKLLWWLDGKPEIEVARLIHVTGNPIKKIVDGVNDKNYTINLHIGAVKTPQIITLLQVALWISDQQAMNKRNMGVPFAILIKPGDRPAMAKLAEEYGFDTQVVGSAIRETTTSDEEKKNTISGVWLRKSTITF